MKTIRPFLTVASAALLAVACAAPAAPPAATPAPTMAPTRAATLAPAVTPTAPVRPATPTAAPKPTQTPRSTTTAAPTATAAPTRTPTAVPQARVTEVVLAKGVKDFTPVDPTTAFRQGTKEFFLVGRVIDAPRGTKLKANWVAVDVPGHQGSDRVLERELSIDGSRPFVFSLEIRQPLPAGQYAAELSLDGTVVRTLDFAVLPPVIPVLARSENELPRAPGASPPADIKPANLQFIVDASGSMADPVGGMPKMDAAREAFHALVSALPSSSETLNVGLRAYAHRHPTDDKTKSCEDAELLVPMQGVDKAKLRGAIDALKPTGWTPMAFAVQQAANDFTPGDDQNVVVLVSDGEETCVQDPVSVIKAAAEPAKLVVHVVGFDIGQEQARKQLQTIAEATGGVYADARTADELTAALRTITAEKVQVIRVRAGTGQLTLEPPEGATFFQWTIKDADGKEAVKEFGDSAKPAYQLPAGLYTVEFKPAQLGDGALFRVEIAAGQESVLRLGALKILPRQKPFKWALVDQVSERRVSHPFDVPRDAVLVPPGRYTVLVQPTQLGDELAVVKDLEVKPNSIVEVEL